MRAPAEARVVAGPMSEGARSSFGFTREKTRQRHCAPGMSFSNRSRIGPHTPEGTFSPRCGARSPGSRLPTRGAFPSGLSGQWHACRFRSEYSGGGRAGFSPASLNHAAIALGTGTVSACQHPQGVPLVVSSAPNSSASLKKGTAPS